MHNSPLSPGSILVELRSLYYLAITRTGPFALIILADREIKPRSSGSAGDALKQLVESIINVPVTLHPIPVTKCNYRPNWR